MFKVSWILDFLLGPKLYFDSGQPTTPEKTTQVTELPEWAKGYAKDTLAKGAALTDINQNPYKNYGGQRIAGFQPLQEQAFKTVGGMDAGPAGFQAGIGQYMSPYMQNVVDVEKREAGRQSAIQGTQQQAQATQAGAFGGGRDAIMRAERERNLSQQMGDIQARGSQAAYDNAANQFRQGITQQSGLAQMQGQFGQQQQQQAQRPLDTAYQDFLNQQNYPYKQLGFMSDLVNRMPLGQQSTSSVYQGSGPGMVQTLAGLGGAAYGFGKSGLFGAEGGLMESYADGGVTSDQNVQSILSKLSDSQLAQAKEAALNRRDVEEAQMIDAEMAERASIRGGLGGAFNQIPVEQQEAMMAGGGMVAFAKGGDTYGNRFEQSMSALQDMAKNQPPVQTAEQYEQGVMSRQPMVEKLMGEDVTKPYLEETKSKREGLAGQFEKDKGLAFALGSLKLLSPSKKTRGMSEKDQLLSGLGEAGEAFIGEVGRLKKEHTDADDKLRQSEILLATAQQARKEGNVKLAMSLEDKAAAQKQDAYKTQIGVQEKVATIQGSLAGTELQGKNAKEVAQITAAAHRDVANKPGEFERMLSDYEKRVGKKLTPEEYKQAMGEIGAARYGAKYTGPDTTFANDAKFQAELDKRTSMLNLQKARPGVTQEDIDKINGLIEGERQKLIEEFRQTRASGVTSKNQAVPGAAPASNATTAAPAQSPLFVTTPDGQTFRFKTPVEADKFRKQIGG
jgi:hypothetical protein